MKLGFIGLVPHGTVHNIVCNGCFLMNDIINQGINGVILNIAHVLDQ